MIEPSVTPDNPGRNPSRKALPRIVLASGSPRRAEILSGSGLNVEVRPTDIPEGRSSGDMSVEGWAVRLAQNKAAAVHTAADAIKIGADTMVVIGDEVLGKPSGPEDAAATLRRLRGGNHRVITAVAVDGPSGKWAGWSSTDVEVRELSDEEIDKYVSSGLPLDKAGSYGIQDRPFRPARRVLGCYLNVVGLPLCLTEELFRTAGYDINLECGDCERPMNTLDVTP